MRKSVGRIAILGAALAAPLYSQWLQVVSEFQRYGPDGKVLEADRLDKPREIISPAVARNGYATFRIIVRPPDARQFNLFIAQNPDGIIQAKLYQERYVEAGEARVPEGLTEVPLSLSSAVSGGAKAQTYLLDLFVPANADVQRIRVEVQFNIGDDWIIYPLEVRVQDAVVKKAAESWGSWKDYLCGGKPQEQKAPTAGTLASIAYRNLQQDLALLRAREQQTEVPRAARDMVSHAAGYPIAKEYCEAGGVPKTRGVEWVLRARDFLIQGHSIP